MQAVFCLVAALLISVAYSSGSDVNAIILRAAGTNTYNHKTGGGAWNDGTIGDDADIKGELQGRDYRCGDLVTHFLSIQMKSTVTDASQCITVDLDFTADATGKPGVAYGEIFQYDQSFLSRTKLVENGANGTPNGLTCVANGNPGPGRFGRDCAPLSIGRTGYPQFNEVVSYVEGSTYFTAPMFSSNAANMKLKVRGCGLEAGEVMVIRFDAKIYCNPGFSPTGNLQASVDGANSEADGSKVTVGGQLVPLKGVDNIVGAQGCTAPPVTISANDFNSTVTIYSSSQSSGGNYQRILWYSWSLGQYKLQNVLNPNVAEVHTFDTACSFLHDGVTQYTQSTCGCEATFISNTQPQLFLSLNSSFYSTTFTIETVAGQTVNHYTRIDTASSVTDLYLLSSNTNIVVQATFDNGEYWVFSNFIPGPQSPTLFTLNNGIANSTCTCKRAIVMMVVMERDRYVTNSDWAFMVTFAGAILPAQFSNATTGSPIPFLAANIGLMYYDCPTATAARNVVTLPVIDGYAYQQVRAAAYRSDTMSCLSSNNCGSTSCTTGTWASPSQAIIFAANQLNTSQKLGQRVILLINRGWNPLVALNQETTAMLTNAVAYAENLGCKVLAVTFSTVQWLNDLNWQVSAQDPDNLVYRYLASDLIKVDSSFPVSIVSRICVAQANPCGSCCGQCEPTCGTCLSVSSCAPTNNCSFTSELVGNATKCCVINTNPVDPCKTSGTCQSAVCNPTTGQCSYTNTCTGADTACFNYNCVAGSCVKTTKVPPNTETTCTISQCVNNSGVFSITSTPRVCPTQNCFTFQCIEGQGCVGTAVVVPNNCFVCDTADGVVKPRVCPTPTNLCEVSTCSAATGFACNIGPKFPAGCRNLSDACDTSACNPATGNCQTTSKSCPAPANKCNVTSCNSLTGNCDFTTTICTQNNATQAAECQAATCNTLVVCAPSTGLCSCSSSTCAPTRAPTAAPTRAPTRAPTPNPTFAPTNAPTPAPTRGPTNSPTETPTNAPSNAPTAFPTNAPTANPTGPPVAFPTDAPTETPTTMPTTMPTATPTNAPTQFPTWAPTATPTEYPTRMPTTAPTEEPTTAPTNAPTAAPTALCVNGVDCIFDACSQSICLDGNYELGEQKCTTPVETNCTALLEERGIDYCVVDVTCDPALGCVFTTKTCPQPSNPCKTAVADKTNPNCCIEIDFTCNDNTSCTTYTCDTSSPSRPPTCIANDLCVSDPNNKCILTGCAGGAIGCSNTTITCESTPCSSAVCNPATGLCEATPVDCDDKLNCTIDTCNPATGCVFTPIVCPPSTDLCRIANVCDPASGGCPTTPKNCDDGIECTIDSCDSVTGNCVHVVDDFYCQDPNPCVINGTCTLTGCTASPRNCTADLDKQTFCTNWRCIDFLGCSGEPRQCANETNGTCTVFNCSETRRECEKTESPCLSFFGIVAGLIVAGLVVGVVAAALIIAGATAGSASYAVSQSANNEKNQSVNANPLYRGGGRAQEVTLGM